MARRVLVLVAAAALLGAAAAGAAPRMWVGFQDDWGFRWGQGRAGLLAEADAAGVSVIRTTVYWHRIAAHRPRRARDPFDPAYRSLADLDELVRQAQRRGIQLLLTIWGTPAWANGGAGINRLPHRLSDLEDFAHALASRYSGRYPGYPFVGLYSVWNEPSLEQFLAPQFGSRGESLAPRLYARLFRAARAGIASGNPAARVAVGETSHAGKDDPAPRGFQASHSPARFAELLARQRPRLRFDAWAHHPYPDDVRLGPEQPGRWPNVTIGRLGRFEASLDRWFGRPVPIWLSEYGYETRPQTRRGVTHRQQARFLERAFGAARNDPKVELFVWFVFRDRADVPWQGGIVERSGRRKPAFGVFSRLARSVDARHPIVVVDSAAPTPLVRVPAIQLGYYDRPGSWLGVTYSVFSGARLVTVGQPRLPLGRDGWVTIPVGLWPVGGSRYVMHVRAEDIHGNVVRSRVELVAAGEGGPPAGAPAVCRGAVTTDACVR